jgi:hypothetical protein
VTLVPDLDHVEVLAEDRAALWARIGAAPFLTDAEKRRMLGIGEDRVMSAPPIDTQPERPIAHRVIPACARMTPRRN